MSTHPPDTAPTRESLEFISALAQDALAEIRAVCRVALQATSGSSKHPEQDDMRMLLRMVVTRAELTIAHISDAEASRDGEFSRRRLGGGGVTTFPGEINPVFSRDTMRLQAH